jgi:hypothetical protein
VSLAEALGLTLLLVEGEPQKYERAALRWHVRSVEETKNVDIRESQAVLALLTAIPANALAAAALAELLSRRRSCERIAEALVAWARGAYEFGTYARRFDPTLRLMSTALEEADSSRRRTTGKPSRPSGSSRQRSVWIEIASSGRAGLPTRSRRGRKEEDRKMPGFCATFSPAVPRRK